MSRADWEQQVRLATAFDVKQIDRTVKAAIIPGLTTAPTSGWRRRLRAIREHAF
jgi:hypothetical protein